MAELVYGELYHIQNGYSDWGGGYLDTRGRGCEGNLFCVSTATGTDRDNGSGTWRIVGHKNSGEKVLFNEPFHLFNLYSGNGGYLDTRGSGCEGNLLCVSTADVKDRDLGSGLWKMFPDSKYSIVISENEPVHILNGYSDWCGGFLDTRGSGCEGNQLCVSTAAGWNRDLGSTHWRFIKAHLKK
jgi:hypothetical protein